MSTTPQSRVPATLESLSDELLDMICKEICAHCTGEPLYAHVEDDDILAHQAFASLCKMSRRMRNIAQPYLYHRLLTPRLMRSFIRTLIARPDLAASVRQYFEFDPFGANPDYEQDPKFYQKAAGGLSFELPETDLGASQLWIELAVSLMSRLEIMGVQPNLHIGGFPDWTPDYFERRCEKIRSHPSSSTLRDLRVESGELFGFNLGSKELLRLLQMFSHLETLKIYKLTGLWELNYDINGMFDMDKIEPSVRHLKTLELSRSGLGDDDEGRQYRQFEKLFSFCPKLEAFRYHHQSPYVGENIQRVVLPGRILAALSQRKETLKSLDLDLSDWDEDGEATPRALLVGPQLLEFEMLETLKLDERSFCNHWPMLIPETEYRHDAPHRCLVNVLGQRVQSLQVTLLEQTQAWGDVVALAEDVKAGKFPALRELTILQMHRSEWIKPAELHRKEEVLNSLHEKNMVTSFGLREYYKDENCL